jgi:hypothetical protein
VSLLSKQYMPLLNLASVIETWSYIKVHLELHMLFQRLGLVPVSQLLPPPSFFIPFSSTSPIPSPGPLESFTISSITAWLGSAIISAGPFLAFTMVRRFVRDCRPPTWTSIYRQLPNTTMRGRRSALLAALPPPPAPPPAPAASAPTTTSTPNLPAGAQEEWEEVVGNLDATTPAEASTSVDRPSIPTVRRQSVLSARGDEYVSDDEEPETVTATLISLDIEATDHDHDAPPGLWSAELRPSLNSDSRSRPSLPLFFDTTLTRLSPVLAAGVFTDTALRLFITPFEATALRLVARSYSMQHLIPCPAIYDVRFIQGNGWASVANLLGAEFLHFAILSDVWAAFTALSMYFHLTEEEWKESEQSNTAVS